jgi:hypothetical protein
MNNQVKVYIQLRVDNASPTWIDVSSRCEYDNLEWEKNDQGTAAILRLNMFTILPKSTTRWQDYSGATDTLKLQAAVNDEKFLIPFTDHAEVQVRDASTSPETILFSGIITRWDSVKDGGFLSHSIEAADYTELLAEAVVQYYYPPVDSTIQQILTADDTVFTVSKKKKTSNVVTLTLSSLTIAAPYSRTLEESDYIYVSLDDVAFDGYWRISSVEPTTNAITYAMSGDDVAEVSITKSARILSLFGSTATPRTDSRIVRSSAYIENINPNFLIRKRLSDSSVDPIFFGGRTIRQAIDSMVNRTGGTYWIDSGALDVASPTIGSITMTMNLHLGDTNPKNWADSDDSIFSIMTRTRVNDLVTLKLDSLALGRPYSRNLQVGDVVTVLTGTDDMDGKKTLTAVSTTDSTVSYTAVGTNIASNTVTITGATFSTPNTTTTYTAKHSFTLGQVVTITGITPSTFNKASASITAYTATTFTVGVVSSGTYTSGGTATHDGYPITAISGNGNFATYTSGNALRAGDYISITGSSIAGYNATLVRVYSATTTQFVTRNITTGTPTLTSSKALVVAEENGGQVTVPGMSGIWDQANTVGWSFGTYTLEASTGPYGAGYTAKTTAGGGGPFELTFSSAAYVPVSPGEKWFYSVRAKSSASQKAHLYVNYYNSSKVLVSTVQLGNHVLGNDNWELLYDVHEVPSGIAYLAPVAHTDSGSHISYYTDFKVIKITAAFGFHEYPSLAGTTRTDRPSGTTLDIDTYDFEVPDAPKESGEAANTLYLYTIQTISTADQGGIVAKNTKSTYTSVQGIWNAGGKIIEAAMADERAATLDLADMKAEDYFGSMGQTIESYTFDHEQGSLDIGSTIPFFWETAGVAKALIVRSQRGYLIGQDVYYNVQLGGDPKFQKNSIYLIDRQIMQSTDESATLNPSTDPGATDPGGGGKSGNLEIPTDAVAVLKPGASIQVSWAYSKDIMAYTNFGGFRIRWKSKNDPAIGGTVIEDKDWSYITQAGIAATFATVYDHNALDRTRYYQYQIAVINADTGVQTEWSASSNWALPGPTTANVLDSNIIEINNFSAGVKPVPILTQAQANSATVANGYAINTIAVITTAVTYTYTSGTATSTVPIGTAVTVPAGSLWKRFQDTGGTLVVDWAPGGGINITADSITAGTISAGIIAGGSLTLSGLTGGSYAIQSLSSGTQTFSVTAAGQLAASGAYFDPITRTSGSSTYYRPAIIVAGNTNEGDIAAASNGTLNLGVTTLGATGDALSGQFTNVLQMTSSIITANKQISMNGVGIQLNNNNILGVNRMEINDVGIGEGVIFKNDRTSGALDFGIYQTDSGTDSLIFGTALNGGTWTERASLTTTGSLALQDKIYLGGSGTEYIDYNGTNFIISANFGSVSQQLFTYAASFTAPDMVAGGMAVIGNPTRYFYVGDVTAGEYRVVLSSVSDRRLKQEISPYSGALEKILSLNPVTFKWKENPEAGNFLGLLADEVNAIEPLLSDIQVLKETDPRSEYIEDGQMGVLEISGTEALAITASAIKELHAKIEALEAKIN